MSAVWEEADGTVTIKRAERGAVVYPIVGVTPTKWRIRFERYPDDVDGGSWAGGKVQWDRDTTDKDQAIEVAFGWVERGVGLA